MSQRTNFTYFEGQLFSYEERQVGKSTISRMRIRVPTGKRNNEPTSAFIDVDAWDLQDALRKNLNDNQKKGRVLVQGELRQDNWEDKKTGAKRSKLFINAKVVVFQGSWKNDEEDVPAASSTVSTTKTTEDVPF